MSLMSSIRASHAVRLTQEFVGYLGASVAALALDVGVLWGLTHLMDTNYLLASAIGYCTGAVLHYILSVKLVFGARRVESPRLEFVLFSAIGVIGLIATQLVLKLFVDALHTDVMIGKVFAVGVSFVLNFTVRKAVLFSVRPAVAGKRG